MTRCGTTEGMDGSREPQVEVWTGFEWQGRDRPERRAEVVSLRTEMVLRHQWLDLAGDDHDRYDESNATLHMACFRQAAGIWRASAAMRLTKVENITDSLSLEMWARDERAYALREISVNDALQRALRDGRCYDLTRLVTAYEAGRDDNISNAISDCFRLLGLGVRSSAAHTELLGVDPGPETWWLFTVSPSVRWMLDHAGVGYEVFLDGSPSGSDKATLAGLPIFSTGVSVLEDTPQVAARTLVWGYAGIADRLSGNMS